MGRSPRGASALALKELHRALVLLGRGARLERSQVPAPPGFGIELARIEPVLTGSELSDHRCNPPNGSRCGPLEPALDTPRELQISPSGLSVCHCRTTRGAAASDRNQGAAPRRASVKAQAQSAPATTTPIHESSMGTVQAPICAGQAYASRKLCNRVTAPNNSPVMNK